METTANVWSEVAMEAQREMLLDLNRQLAQYHLAVLSLMALAGRAGAPIPEIVAAVKPCMPDGPVPVDEQGPGHTEPMERDIEAIRRADEGTEGGRPTLRLQTVGGDL